MALRNPHDKTTIDDEKGLEVALEDGAATVERPGRSGSRAWLLGAYTLLFIWGIAYLVLFFTDRLPI